MNEIHECKNKIFSIVIAMDNRLCTWNTINHYLMRTSLQITEQMVCKVLPHICCILSVRCSLLPVGSFQRRMPSMPSSSQFRCTDSCWRKSVGLATGTLLGPYTSTCPHTQSRNNLVHACLFTCLHVFMCVCRRHLTGITGQRIFVCV